MVIVYIGTDYIQVLYLGRVPHTNETLPDFHEWCRVTRHPLVFCELTGSQRTPGNWGVTIILLICVLFHLLWFLANCYLCFYQCITRFNG